MATPVFSFSENPFDNGTKGSFKKMNIVSADTDSKLFGQQSNPDIQTLYLFFHPVRNGYLSRYTQWKSAKATYRGATATVYNLLTELSRSKIEDFDIHIQTIYKRGTPQYIALFPEFRNPFQTGEIDERIAALDILLTNIGNDPALATIKTEINSFYQTLSGARNQQQGAEGNTNSLSAQLELERKICAAAMYSVLGGLMRIYSTNPSQISSYFDLETLRGALPDDEEPETVTHNIHAGQVINLFSNLQSGSVGTIKVKNNSPMGVFIHFYFADNTAQPYTGNGITIQSGEEKVFTEQELGAFQPFLNAQNPTENDGSFNVTVS